MRFIERLTKSEPAEPQAKAIADGIQNDIDLQRMATKEDITLLKEDITLLRADFLELKVDLFRWLVPILLGQSGFIVALMKIFH
jgi:hypothetical protein